MPLHTWNLRLRWNSLTPSFAAAFNRPEKATGGKTGFLFVMDALLKAREGEFRRGSSLMVLVGSVMMCGRNVCRCYSLEFSIRLIPTS